MGRISYLLNKEKLRKVINQTISILSVKLSEEGIDKLTSSIFSFNNNIQTFPEFSVEIVFMMNFLQVILENSDLL
ncbi:MAG: hypothetical protein J7J36_02595 [Thermoplasmata archaeon]|nr:hypothetical protein [Thermoplasmata archaeon]